MKHRPEDLVTLFDSLFRQSFGTVLVLGGHEPLYRPDGGPDNCAQVIFAHGYFASALHETSHWCIAGPARRRLTDYGYWYCPDGRTQAQQAEFERVEVKPQALEWLFSIACGHRFHISVDNLSGEGSADPEGFREAVRRQALDYLATGLPPRAGQFLTALTEFYASADNYSRLASEALGEPCGPYPVFRNKPAKTDDPAPHLVSGQNLKVNEAL